MSEGSLQDESVKHHIAKFVFSSILHRAQPPGGMTRSIQLTYLRPLPLPATVRVESKVMQMGRTMGLVRGDITSRDGKKVYFTGEQHKATSPGLVPESRKSEARKSKL